MSKSAQSKTASDGTDVKDVAVSTVGTPFDCASGCFFARARRGGVSAQNLPRLCESSSLSQTLFSGRGGGAMHS